MTSSAIGISLVSANLPNWPHCTEIQQLHAHRQKGPLLWVKLVYIEPSFPTKSCSTSSFTITVNQLRLVLSYFQLLCSVCLFYLWCSSFNQPFKVSSSCAETIQSTQQLYFTPLCGFLVEKKQQWVLLFSFCPYSGSLIGKHLGTTFCYAETLVCLIRYHPASADLWFRGHLQKPLRQQAPL
jgi:hypothetical protein